MTDEPPTDPAAGRRARVVVVGAGFAGLAAADALHRAGVDVVVLEARDRVGGRVHAARIANGGLVERGAEFITAGYDATERYAARLGLSLDDMGIRYPERDLRPDPGLDRGALLSACAAVEAAAGAAPEAGAMDVLRDVVADPDIRELFASRIQSSRAYPVDRMDARALLGVRKLLADDGTRRVRGGNDRLAMALAQPLGTALHTGAAVRAVEHDDVRVRVATDTGSVEADACVLAVPLPLLADLDLRPGLPEPVRAALAATPMGTAAKLAVPLAEPAAPAAIMSVPHRFWAYTTTSDEIGGRVVGSWAGSEPVVRSLAVEHGPEAWVDRVRELWPELALEGSGAVLTTWDDDPWARGVYSVLPPADAQGNPVLAAAFGRIVLAGEHTAGAWSATMEGALRSGERAAADVLRRLGRPAARVAE